MNEVPKSLDKFLGEAYRARFLTQVGVEHVRAELVQAMQDRPDLSEEVKKAHTRYNSVNRPGGQVRCVISKAHADFLTDVISEVANG